MRKGRKMMTGRERVYAALDFKTPDRAPRDLWALPYLSLFQQRELDELLEQYPCDIGRPQLSPGSASESLANLSQVGAIPRRVGQSLANS